MTGNIPYVKQFDANGAITNPIMRFYSNYAPNRRERRRGEGRFLNNRNTADIQVVGTRKFRKVLQRYYKADGTIGVVKHWLED